METREGSSGTYTDALGPESIPYTGPAPEKAVKVNFANASKKQSSPFVKASPDSKRLKLFLWGT